VVSVCPTPGPDELPGQEDPITWPLWLVQVCSCVILADAVDINDGATATNANVAATIANNAKVIVLVCINIYCSPDYIRITSNLL
jgi:hypothetical protein